MPQEQTAARITYMTDGAFQRVPLRLVEQGQRRRYGFRAQAASSLEGLETVVVRDVVPALVGRASSGRPVSSSRRRAQADPKAHRLDDFMASLLSDDEMGLHRLAFAALRRDRDPQSVALALFQPAARAVGELWSEDAVDFIRVTLALSRLQRLFHQMVAEAPATGGGDPLRSILLVATPGDQHTFGLTMLEDAYRRAGFLVDMCPDGGQADILALAQRNNYAVIGVSLAAGGLIDAFGSLIRKLKVKSRNKSVSIFAGGSRFIDSPELALNAGADYVAEDSRSAVALAETVIASSMAHIHIACAAE